MLAGTGAMFTRVPREMLEGLGVPEDRTYISRLASGCRVQGTRGRTMIRLQRLEFTTPVTFGVTGEPALLGDLTLGDALLTVDPHTGRLTPV